MSSSNVSYGERLTEEEYHRELDQVPNLVMQRADGSESNEYLEEQMALMEFQLLVDRQLGKAFPHEKRNDLAAAYRQMYRSQQALASSNSPRWPLGMLGRALAMRRLFRAFSKRCRKILTDDEHRALFGFARGKQPLLPFNPFRAPLTS